MTATRPLYPIYLSILRQVAALGEATCRALVDVPRPASKLSDMVERGWLLTPGFTTVPSTNHHTFRVRVYRITESGRAALASGLTEDGNAFRASISTFNNRQQAHGKPPKPLQTCVHVYDVGPPPQQHHQCRLCDKHFDVRMTYGLEMAKVGAGKVRPSERFAMKEERDE